MSSDNIETKKVQLEEVIKSFKESTDVHEKCKSLASIRSIIVKSESMETLLEGQLKRICKVATDAFASKDTALYNEARLTLTALLRCYSNRKLNIFKELMKSSLDSRVKLFKLLNELPDEMLQALAQDDHIVEYFWACQNVLDTMEWLAPDISTDSTKLAQLINHETLSEDIQLEEQMSICILKMLYRLHLVAVPSYYAECEKFNAFFVSTVTALAYMGNKRQRASAIDILQLPDIGHHIRTTSPTIWQNYKSALQNLYCHRMDFLVTTCNPDWSVLWGISVQLLGTELHRGAGLINNLLSVEEKAFKSVDTVVRRQAFVSWKLIVDNFALDENELATTRRVKLLCIPLNAKNSKTEAMTLTKLEVWWHLIIKLYKHIQKFANPVLTQFLNFCFGPLGDTPLMSSKFNVIPSPGKRFSKSKIVGVDALLQLLTQNPENLNKLDCPLKERITAALSSEVFQECFKPLIHSVGEAILSLASVSHEELQTRDEVIAILWRSLLTQVKSIKIEPPQALIYKEIMHLVLAINDHVDSKPVVRDSMLDVILPTLDEYPTNYVFHSEVIIGLMSMVMKPAILIKIDMQHQDLIKRILSRETRIDAPRTSVWNTFDLLKKIVKKFVSIQFDSKIAKGVSILWLVLCEMLTKYVTDGEEVNEGDAASHDFTTTHNLLKFPFTENFAPEFWQLKKAVVTWKSLYAKFSLQANLVPTVKPNELVCFAIDVIQNGIKSDERCAGFAVLCLDGILTTMNYNHVLDENGFLPIVTLINHLCILNLPTDKSREAEAALRALSSVLITLYGHTPTKVASCLEAVRPAIEHMLKPYKDESLASEISSTWETVISIFKGLGPLLSPEVIKSFRTAISLALQHNKPEIVSQTLTCLESAENLKESTKDLVESFLKNAENTETNKKNGSSTSTDHPENGEKQMKQPKLAGSFLNRKNSCPSPKTVTKVSTATEKARDDTKSPFFRDSESQEYVMIKSNFKFDASRLTDHQKESLRRRREDIPALYNDLSQSCSQDTENIQEWFDKKKNEIDRVMTRNALESQSVPVADANKETKEDQRSDTSNSPNGEKPEEQKTDTEKKNDQEDEEGPTCKDQNPVTDGLALNNLEATNSMAQGFDDESPKQNSSTSPSTSRIRAAAEEKSGIKTRQNKETESERDSVSTTDTKKQHSETKRGVKRKATVSDSDSDGNAVIPTRRRMRTLHGSQAEAISDSDSVKSGENEEALKQLSKRTKNEMSRLRINMVFDINQFSTLPSRRRSKLYRKGESVSPNNSQESTASGETTKKRVSRNSLPESSNKTSGKVSSKDNKKEKEKEEEEEKEKDSKFGKQQRKKARNAASEQTTLENILPEITLRRVISPEKGKSGPSEPLKTGKTKPCDNADTKVGKEAIKPTSRTPSPDPVESKSLQSNSQSSDDSEEIVESSQASNTSPTLLEKKFNNKQCFIRINKIQPGRTVKPDIYNAKTKDNTDSEHDGSSKVCKKNILDAENPLTEDNDEPDPKHNININGNAGLEVGGEEKEVVKSNESNIPTPQAVGDEAPLQVNFASPETSKERRLDWISSPIKLSTTVLNSSSPKNDLKRFSKSKSIPGQGRAAHMLGLVTKQALAEKRCEINEEDISPIKKPRGKETEDEFLGGKKEQRVGLLKEPERLGSPSGSRQEKIFNKMKTPDMDVDHNPFSNLKNDGEKVSPLGNRNAGKERNIWETTASSTQIDKSGDNNGEENTSPLQEREALPMLEWSSANPPSLTASPSVSILKRQRQPPVENEPESPSVASKRKRVSFADPPVSKEMGYEITASTTPHRMNKLPIARMLLPRKDSPVRLKQSKLKAFQTTPHAGMSDKDSDMAFDKFDESASQVDLTPNNESSKVPSDTENSVLSFTETQNRLSSATDNGDQIPVALSSKVTIDNLTMEVEIASGSRDLVCQDPDIILIEEVNTNCPPKSGKKKICETETQQDIFEFVNTTAVDHDNETLKTPKTDSQRGPKSGAKNSPDETSLRCVDIKILTTPISKENKDTNSSIDTLEDTVDIRNGTILNSTTSSNEMSFSKPERMSTQTSEFDTLPVTDSIFSNLPFNSQSSQASTQDTMEFDHPELLDSTKSIYPSLTDSNVSINSVIGYLADPIWKPHLTTYLTSNGIETVGNLAQLSEREINRIPVKRSPKVPFVKNVLQHFEKSIISLPSTGSMADMSHSSITTTPNASMCSLSPINPPVAQSSSLSGQIVGKFTSGKIPINESPPTIAKETKSTETQLSVADLLDRVDASVLLKNAITRSSAENILANYKMKMRYMADEDLELETIKMLGIEPKHHADSHLKSACRASGASKVLGRLPDIFSHDKAFFTKVLTCYRRKLSVSDWLDGLEFEEVKAAVCQRCTSSDLAEMLSKKLKDEEEAGITTPMTELSSLQAMLKRMPKDLVISHTVANEELISPAIILDIALQNNNPSEVAFALEAQPMALKNRIFGALCTTEALINKIGERDFSDKTATEILKILVNKFETPKLLDFFNEILKKKWNETRY
ncbi:telomere-associated protein RIF1 isoform X1 [Athalia rosae]|uniref:telomere-associated protein RIF1 isoform X1 n=1 Tax=Athalia rosae TaxID=37344 RepID=UPI00203453FF|nr:telomere-associated protein RIF1 isoform X1 [Athalia rosae]XP_048511961.1 telomere-associated protein RIF1 isoform X1 [Athalia rosae]